MEFWCRVYFGPQNTTCNKTGRNFVTGGFSVSPAYTTTLIILLQSPSMNRHRVLVVDITALSKMQTDMPALFQS
ncbi:hypothetical protein CEXT_747521 [Caerostris extrusa]|uniref:Uncharacterized protein n=1 Tax=Caerostris extrusa TaxID=172846 RepID=A0AAV4TB38_CAEEX|nr:hypothetical protein CEXT_747521 [Caerostris extrusa]